MSEAPKVIDQMYAFVYIEEDSGDEAVPAFRNGSTWLPLVGADMNRVESLMEIARVVVEQTGRPLKIYRFSTREQIGEVNP